MGLEGKVKEPEVYSHSPLIFAKVMASAIPQYSKLITDYYTSLVRFDVLMSSVAVKVFELKNGAAPDDLQAFVPAYLPDIPTDPFNHFAPLKYERKKAGWVVYSLGPDR